MKYSYNYPDAAFDVAIIGGGFCGVMTAVNLLKASPAPLRIALIEKRGQLGAGAAFSTDDRSHLLNVALDRMGAFADNPQDFLQWCLRNQFRYPYRETIITNPYVPRCDYRLYLQETLAQAEKDHPESKVFPIFDECLDLDEGPAGPRLKLLKGQSLSCRQVVLAISHLEPVYLVPKPWATDGTGRYIHNLWGPEGSQILAKIGPRDRILLLGTGLSMVDTFLTLSQKPRLVPITAISRHGLLPQSHPADIKPAIQHAKEALMKSPQNICHILRRQIRTGAPEGQQWQQIIDGLRPLNQTLWGHMSLRERQSFLRHGKTYWDTHRHRMAPSVARNLNLGLEESRLKIIAGRIEEWSRDGQGVMTLTYKTRGHAKSSELGADYVINCTGGTLSPAKTTDPLMVNLKRSGFIEPHPTGLGIRTSRQGLVLSRGGGDVPWLHVLGALRTGDLGESTAVPELRVQAAEVARHILAVKDVGT